MRTAPSRNSWSNFLRVSDMTTPHSACLHALGGYPEREKPRRAWYRGLDRAKVRVLLQSGAYKEAAAHSYKRRIRLIEAMGDRSVMTKGLISVVALMTVVAPVAHADTTGGGDSQFLSIIHQHILGLSCNDGGDSCLPGLGHAVCQELANDYGDRSLMQQKLANKWKSESDAAWFITASAVAYCPIFIKSSDRW